MFVESYGDWLYATSLSTAIRETTWIIPAVQSIHIMAIAIIVGSALVTELRLAGVLATEQAPSSVVRRYLPWMLWALAVLLTSGTVLVVAEPNRTLGNTVFWTKMALVLCAFLVMLLLRRPLLDAGFADTGRGRLSALKPIAWMMMLVWIAVIFCGRFIAYT